jgi:hypothetical protein
VIIDDSDNVTGVTSITVDGLTSGRVVFTDTGGLLTTATTRTANTVFSGPTTGAAAVPAFRALVPDDLPAGTGTVTSVAVSGSNGIGVSGSPITSSGTITLSLGAITPTSVSTGAVTSSTLTSGRIPLVSTAGLIIDSSVFLWADSAFVKRIQVTGSGSAGNEFAITNSHATGESVLQASTQGGDCYSRYVANTGSTAWQSGQDVSDSNAFKIARGAFGGSLDYLKIDTSGVQTNTNKIYPGTDAAAAQTAAGIYAGTGAPNNANGSDGDFYMRGDGGVLTTIYQRRAGAWVGVV